MSLSADPQRRWRDALLRAREAARESIRTHLCSGRHLTPGAQRDALDVVDAAREAARESIRDDLLSDPVMAMHLVSVSAGWTSAEGPGAAADMSRSELVAAWAMAALDSGCTWSDQAARAVSDEADEHGLHLGRGADTSMREQAEIVLALMRPGASWVRAVLGAERGGLCEARVERRCQGERWHAAGVLRLPPQEQGGRRVREAAAELLGDGADPDSVVVVYA